MKPAFKALIFDLDGTLVDSSGVVLQVMKAWCLKNNIPLQSVLDVCGGSRTEDTISLVAPHLCAVTEAAQIELSESTSLDGLLAIEGADRFLSRLTAYPWAIVTSSTLLTAKPKLEICKMPTPKVFVTAESVERGKPHPEPFLRAANELGVAPEDCLVFEDADHGVNAALAAGCAVIVVGETCQIKDARIISRMASFAEMDVTPEGDLKAGHQIIATLSRQKVLPQVSDQ